MTIIIIISILSLAVVLLAIQCHHLDKCLHATQVVVKDVVKVIAKLNPA